LGVGAQGGFMKRTIRVTITHATVAAIVASALVGCSSSREPSVLETPSVVWPHGEPSGVHESSEWVQAIRSADLAWAVADANLDYSDPALVEKVGYATAEAAADRMASTRARFAAGGDAQFAHSALLDGPQGRAVLGIFELSDTEADVVLCTSVPNENPDFRTVETLRVTRNELGRYRVTISADPVPANATATWEEYQAQCDEAEIHHGYFDPPFEPNLDPEAKVTRPAEASKYSLD